MSGIFLFVCLSCVCTKVNKQQKTLLAMFTRIDKDRHFGIIVLCICLFKRGKKMQKRTQFSIRVRLRGGFMCMRMFKKCVSTELSSLL